MAGTIIRLQTLKSLSLSRLGVFSPRGAPVGTSPALLQLVKTTLAIPVWDDQVSTTFDFARALLVVEVDKGREVSRKEVALGDEPAARTARRIRDMGVEVLLCGAVSQPMAQAVSRTGIQIIPYVSGPVDEVLGAYLCRRLSEPRFMQPGCRSGARRRWRHRCGRCGPR